jgi:predicted permease
MDLFITTFESVAVLLGIGFLGFLLIKKNLVPEKALGVLSPLALDIALPSLIFVNILVYFNPNEPSDWWTLPLWWAMFTTIIVLLTITSMFISQKSTRREFAISLFFQNGLFFPLAILVGMFPQNPSYLVTLFIFTIFYPAFFFNTYHFFFRKKGNFIDWKKVFHPVLIVTIIAIVICLLNGQHYIPHFAIRILDLLGGMTIPLIMILLGGNIYIDFHRKGTILKFEIVKFVLIKNILFPLIFLAIILLIHPPYIIALILLLQSAVPPVTAVTLMTERAGGDRSIVNQFIVASFIFSLISIPLMVILFSQIYI